MFFSHGVVIVSMTMNLLKISKYLCWSLLVSHKFIHAKSCYCTDVCEEFVSGGREENSCK